MNQLTQKGAVMRDSEFLRECATLAGVGIVVLGLLGWGADAAIRHERSKNPIWQFMWSDGNHAPRDIEQAGARFFHFVGSAFAHGR